VEVHCTGRVVRKDASAAAAAGANAKSAKKKKSKSGVACVIDQYEFIRKSKGAK
jgi:hypothetical protein